MPRLTDDTRRTIVELRAAGYTHQAIAAAVGCNQSTISRYLEPFDGRALARAYLRTQALAMARHVYTNGTARDHAKVLHGLGITTDDTP